MAVKTRRKQQQEPTGNERVFCLLKNLLFAYILTGGFLLLLALLLYKFSLSEKTVSICIIGIYIISSLFAGFVMGKKAGEKKFLWGLLTGVLYFLVLAAVSLIVNHTLKDMAGNFFTVFFLCAGSGMLGGMFS